MNHRLENDPPLLDLNQGHGKEIGTIDKNKSKYTTTNKENNYNKKNHTGQIWDNNSKSIDITSVLLKDPDSTPATLITISTDNNIIKRTIAISIAVVIINDRITTPVTIEFRPAKSSSNMNVFEAYYNILNVLKHIDSTLKIITF